MYAPTPRWDTRLGPWLLALAAVVAIASTCLPEGAVGAQDRPEGAADDAPGLVVRLAQLMVSEGGWDARGAYGDHGGVAHVLRRRQALRGDASMLDTLRAYSGPLWAPQTGRHHWVVGLRPDGREPAAWPPELAWDRYRPLWGRVLARSRAFVAGELEDPCPGAHHWGSPSIRVDRIRAARAVRDGRWRRVECRRPTRNRFYRVVGVPREPVAPGS